MAKKFKIKKKRMSPKERLANSCIASILCHLRNAGYDLNGVKHKQLIRMYAEHKGLTIPEGTDLKDWIIRALKRTTTLGPRKKKKGKSKPISRATKFATENRKKMTPAARRFRTMMGNARIGVKSEYIIKNNYSFYLIDFYIPSANLCVEIDGGYHNTPEQKEYDAERDLFLQSKGYKTARLTNEQVMSMSVIQVREFLGL